MSRPDPIVLLFGFIITLALGALALLIGGAIYFGATGGFTYTDKVKVNGVTCVQVRGRLTNEVESISCPARVNR